MIWVTHARTLPDYRLWARFSDGTEGEIDLKDFIAADTRPIVSALLDPATFSAIRVEMDTVVWANGFDLAPEFLRTRAVSHASAWALRDCWHQRSARRRSGTPCATTQRAENDAAAIWSVAEIEALIFAVAMDPHQGDLIPGTGGLRKLRWARSGLG